jgi:hypothetical protein
MVREYFSKKKEIMEDTLKYAKNELENCDIQVALLKQRYEYDLGILNKKITRFQEILTDTGARIKDLDKKIKEGYVYLDIPTGKAYKSEKGAQDAINSRMNARKTIIKEEVPKEPEPIPTKPKNGRARKREKLLEELDRLEKDLKEE